MKFQAKDHVLKNIEDVYKMEKPSLDAGWYGNHHSLKKLSESIPKNAILMQWFDPSPKQDDTIERLLKGDWPKKKNIILQFYANSIEEERNYYSN